MLVRDLTVGMVVFGAWTSAAFSQDIAAGEASFKKCQVCHDVGEEARVKLGPPLTGSRAQGRHRRVQLQRRAQELRSHVERGQLPRVHQGSARQVPDTRMMFVGIKDDAEIGELWAYLKQFGPDGKKK
jgi:cytochrome c